MKKVITGEESVKEKDIPTEEKIKTAALKLFQKKGYAGTKTRDIAEKAGINIALLNYYFRSKEKLFEIIMEESFHKFFLGIREIFEKPDIGIDKKLENIVNNYIDMLLENPHLPLFILSEMQANATGFIDKRKAQKSIIFKEFANAKSFVGQLVDELDCDDPMQVVVNIISLSVFPFVAKPFLMPVTGMDKEEFAKFVEERKKLIPKWIVNMMKKDK